MPVSDGSIIATIITSHIPMKEAAAPSHVCRGILIHAIDMVQPPGIAMPLSIEPVQKIVTPAAAMNSRALVPQKLDSPRAPERGVSSAEAIDVSDAGIRGFTAGTCRDAGPTPG